MKTKILFTILIVAIFASCKNDGDKKDENLCIENSFAGITEVVAPTTGTVGETIVVEVDFRVRNGCGQFGRFIETQNGMSRTIAVEARYEGCICTQDLPIRTVDYQFSQDAAGSYELRFKSDQSNFIVKTIVIE